MVALETSQLFCQLSPSELSALRRVAQERTYAAGRGAVFSFGLPWHRQEAMVNG